MSPVAIDHEHNSPKCHHCHITTPIPLAELIKTHPLRSVVAKDDKDDGESTNGACAIPEDKPKDEKKENLIESLMQEVANHKFKRKKESSPPAASINCSPKNSLNNPEPSKLIRPVHSFLHHESENSIYNKTERLSPPNQDLSLQSLSTNSENISNFDLSSGPSPDLILNAKALNSQKSSLKDQTIFNTISEEHKAEPKLSSFRNTETQTSRGSSVSRATYNKSRDCTSEISSVSLGTQRTKRYRKYNVFFCNLPSGLLFAGYGLLIVIGIVVAVALSQRERRIVQSSALPRRPNFAGAVQVRGPAPRVGAGRPQVRRVRPANRPQFAPAPPTAPPPPPQVFLDEDFDYLDNAALNEADFRLPAQPKRPQQFQPPQQAFKPVEIQPQFRPQEQAPAQRVQQVAPRHQVAPRQQAPRRGTPNTFKQEFNLQPQTQDEIARGQREPEVQIVKSWSNRNADGTFSWGYINTDGSFKNETKGVDCVVRGVYGYIDEATGETLSFPYESGNPCDPDAPDYYFDYEDGTLNSGGQVVQRVQGGLPSSRRRP